MLRAHCQLSVHIALRRDFSCRFVRRVSNRANAIGLGRHSGRVRDRLLTWSAAGDFVTMQRETSMRTGKWNIVADLLFLAGFMAYGFILISSRDFAPDKAEWIAAYSAGQHFEARLAHVHGNLFAFLNVAIGYLLMRLTIAPRPARWIFWLSLVGMMMPVGILAELLLGAPPLFVLLGGIPMIVAIAWLGVAVAQLPPTLPQDATTRT